MLVLVRPDRDATCLQDRLRGEFVEWGEAIGHSRMIDDVTHPAVRKRRQWIGS